ncbi:MAG TPA: hypothetical protein VMF60_06070 [Acidimicrobiales bacterium]|nr:hypothetical protein [Acidimicrobiales bacterium]
MSRKRRLPALGAAIALLGAVLAGCGGAAHPTGSQKDRGRSHATTTLPHIVLPTTTVPKPAPTTTTTTVPGSPHPTIGPVPTVTRPTVPPTGKGSTTTKPTPPPPAPSR